MVNNMGVDPDEWFNDKPHPHDSMPVARYHDWEDTAPCEYEPPRPEEQIADDWFTEKPDESDEIEKEKTMHQKMYEIAMKHSPWKGGGSENFQGGSEEVQK